MKTVNRSRGARPVATRGWDLEGFGAMRLAMHELRFRVLPFGDFGGGAGLLSLAYLWALHHVPAGLVGLALRAAAWRARTRRRGR